MKRKRDRGTTYLLFISVAALILVVGLISLQPQATLLRLISRGTSLLGYCAIFLAIISAAYLQQVVRIFGRSFIQVHHVLSVAGLILITVHPLTLALESPSWRLFLPSFDSLTSFLRLGGRPAWYLLAIAALAAVWRRRMSRGWRVLHILNYVAFWLGTAHAMMIGTDFQFSAVRLAAIGMSLAVVAVFVQKRFL